MAASEEDTMATMTTTEEIEMDGQDQPKIIEWEELQQELVRLWSLSSALKKAKERKEYLAQKLESAIQVRKEPLHRFNQLEEMGLKLEDKKLAFENLLMHSKVMVEASKTEREQLSVAVRPLLTASKALSTACKRLQETHRLLAGDRGYTHLKNMEKMLKMRQQYMVTQISALYPVKGSAGLAPGKVRSQNKVNRSGVDDSNSQPSILPNVSNSGMSPLTISGLHLFVPPFKKMSFFSHKKEAQRSASALGYVAHVLSRVASYLDVPLRYPLRLGGSHSYISDSAPSIEPMSSDLLVNSAVAINVKPAEFSLFLEGQDPTRAAYAIFLLNKDLEQLLNYIGVESLGPRQVLANLKELYRTIQSQEFIEK
ncbi:vacuolar protein sorting 38-like [Aristolochia californica]|uniref:vacuolar protein sorting 38-like n=1 Tax=Aristolochia californica TaxID=171875 RepID=UPI0035D664DC